MARHPEYKAKYCAMLIEHMSKGFSYETFAATIGTSRQTLYNWEKQYEEFLYTKRIAFDQCQLFWETQGIKGLHSDKEGPNLQASLWMFNMKARFRWKDEDPKGGEKEDRPLTLEDKKKLLIQAERELKILKEELKEIEAPVAKDEE